MKRLTKEDILSFPITSFGRSIGKQLASQVVHELLGYKQLEERLGCPLDVYVKIRQGMVENVYIQRFKMEKMWIGLPITSNGFCAISGLLQQACFWKDYQKTWWLKEDKSE
jgi:hypothetical protein